MEGPPAVGYTAPEEVVVLERMPLDALGKLDRVMLKLWAAEGDRAR